jgi:DNA modification methylase
MIFSPPFASLFTFSSSERDLGNCKDRQDFFEHFAFLITELHRTIKPGRLIAVHCMNLPTKLIKDGYIGITDFRGDIIRAFQKDGMIYHSEVCIQKNPQVAAIRTHAKGLMFKQMHKDSSWSRMGLADYICVFKKKGENEKEIISDLTNDEWIKYAHPIWTDIRETNTLNSIKAEKDEKHMSPLQLDVIERCIRLWSNKDELVASPFGGIGSEGYMAIKLNRKALLCELKKEYFETQQINLQKAIEYNKDLF